MGRAVVTKSISKAEPSPEPSDYNTPFEWKDEWELPKSTDLCSLDEEWECIVDLINEQLVELGKDYVSSDKLSETIVPKLFECNLSSWEEYRKEALKLMGL